MSMDATRNVETPMLTKQAKIIDSGRAPAVQEFLEWLLGEKNFVLATYDDRERLTQVYVRPEALMAEHFEIDLDQIEAERRALLDTIRA